MNDWQVEKVNAFLTPLYLPRNELKMNIHPKDDAKKIQTLNICFHSIYIY